MQSISDFADQAVILPVVAMVGLVMALVGWLRVALTWAVTVPVTLCAAMLAKMYVAAYAGRSRPLGSSRARAGTQPLRRLSMAG